MSDWFDNDALFFEQAQAGQRWQDYVAQYLRSVGLDATSQPLSLRDNIEMIGDYAETVDVWCEGKPIEVKSRNLQFTTPQDFPYRTVLVDTVSGWDQKSPKPYAYVTVSTVTGRMIALPGHDSSSWVKQTRRDATRRITDCFFEARREDWEPIEILVTALRRLRSTGSDAS